MPIDSNPLEHANPPIRQFHLLYHELRPSAAAYSYVIEDGLFRQHVDLFSHLLADGPPIAPVITFDDGHGSDFALAAPILASRALTAHFFITVGWTAKRPGYMDWPQIRALHQAGHTIGAHGWSHIFLTRCTAAKLEIELSRARLTLEDRLGVPISTMSLPGGRANRRVFQACRAAGYTRVFTSSPRAESIPLGFTVGRLNIRGDMQLDWLAQLFAPSSQLRVRIALTHGFKAAARSILGDRVYARLWSIANRHDAEIDSDVQPGHDGAFPASPQEPRA
jgi:peptidoglycan/xylan/chitin deacetylase (PgdA/CDA1 family)